MATRTWLDLTNAVWMTAPQTTGPRRAVLPRLSDPELHLFQRLFSRASRPSRVLVVSAAEAAHLRGVEQRQLCTVCFRLRGCSTWSRGGASNARLSCGRLTLYLRRAFTVRPLFTIGRLAEAAGVNVETVRYYERRGLLEAPPRTPSGYRQYTEEALWRLNFIARAKELGFTLREVEQLVAGRTPSTVLEATRAKLQAVVEQQNDLATVRDRLEVLARLCESGDQDCETLTIPARLRAPQGGAAGRECR